jgi:hypothetical protein
MSKQKQPTVSGGVSAADVTAEEKTGRALVAYLAETGTPEATTSVLERYCDEHDGATAVALYQHLDSTGAATDHRAGTLRKAGKWIYGPTFEPEKLVEQAPSQELAKVRQELSTVRDQLRAAQADNHALAGELRVQRERVQDYTRQITMYRLQLGLSPNDPSATPLPGSLAEVA